LGDRASGRKDIARTNIFTGRIERIEVVKVGESTAGEKRSAGGIGAHIKVYLKNPEVPPILYPMTSLLSRVPSTSKTSITGPYRDSTFHII